MKPILILGGGGHAKVVADTLLASGFEVVGFLDRNPKIGSLIGIRQLGDADPSGFKEYAPDEIMLANGFGSIGDGRLRTLQFEGWKERGFSFLTVLHPAAVLSSAAELEEGGQVMAGAVVQAGCCIGINSIVNTGAVIDHDCRLGAHVHVATGARLSGGVTIGGGGHIGTGAVVLQGISIGENSIVGAGSVVVRDVPSNTRVMGVPAHRNSIALQRPN